MHTDLQNVLEEKKNLENIEKKLEESKTRISNFLEAVLKEKGRSFQHGDKWYQIRKRNGKYYICEFNVKPGSWLKKNKDVT